MEASTAAATATTSAPQNLTEHDPFLTIEMYGQPITLSLWDAGEELAEIDRKHADDPKGSQLFLDSVVDLLKTKYGLPQCSRRGAWKFYCFVVGEEEALKKTIGQTPESGTGSELTPDSGQEPSSAPGSPTSTGSTPSKISGLKIYPTPGLSVSTD